MIGDVPFSLSFHNHLVKKYDVCEFVGPDICNKNHNYFGCVQIESEDSLPTIRRILMYETLKAWLSLFIQTGLVLKILNFAHIACMCFVFI